jgi:hypothetical protein
MVNTFIRLVNGLLPAWLLSARLDTTLQLNEKSPVWEGSGQFGFRLDEKIPVRTLAGTMQQDSISMTVSSALPTWSADGQFGFRLSKVSPTWELSSESSMFSEWYLNKKTPLLTFSGSMYEEPTMQLNQPLYFWSFSGSMSITEEKLVLDAKIPGALLLAGSMYEQDTFQLDATIPLWTFSGSMVSYELTLSANIPGAWLLDGFMSQDMLFTVSSLIPIRELDATMYANEFTLDSLLPIWRMRAVASEGKPDDHPDSSITEDSFSGVLRYIRP